MSGNNSEYCTQCQGPKGNEANNQLANHYGVRYACPRCQTRFEKTRRQDEEYVKEATKDARNLSNMSQEWKDWIHAEGMSGRFKAKLLELRRAGYTARQAVDAFKWGAIWESLPSNVNPNNYGITEYSEGYYNSAYPGREWQPQFAYEPAEASSPAPMLDNRHATQGNLQYSSYSIPPAGASTSTQIRQTTENNTSHQKYYLQYSTTRDEAPTPILIRQSTGNADFHQQRHSRSSSRDSSCPSSRHVSPHQPLADSRERSTNHRIIRVMRNSSPSISRSWSPAIRVVRDPSQGRSPPHHRHSSQRSPSSRHYSRSNLRGRKPRKMNFLQFLFGCFFN